jgi:hypothetical protein
MMRFSSLLYLRHQSLIGSVWNLIICQEKRVDKSLGVLWLSLSALGGLLAFPAIPGYVIATVIPVIFASVAYTSYRTAENRKKFLILAVINLLTGAALYWTPHDVQTGGLSGFGILVGTLVLIPSYVYLWKMFKSESASTQ